MAGKKRIVIVGAGPGGLTAGMILTHRGLDVTVVERLERPGGRNGPLVFDGFSFDIGPTFLMMKHILDKMFALAGHSSEDYLKFTRLSPMYRLHYEDRHLDVHDEDERMRAELARAFPGEERGLQPFMDRERKRFAYLWPCFEKDYSSFTRYFSRDFISAIPHFAIGRSVIDVLGDSFTDERAKLAFTFQAKYLGMSPWVCPGAFAIIAFFEHELGIYHVEGGLSRISEAMAEVVRRNGGSIRLSTEAKRVLFKGRRAVGVELADGTRLMADAVVLNADFGHAMTRLLPKGVAPYPSAKLKRKKYSCSTFMLYLGLDKDYGLPHHNIVFAKGYQKNVDAVFEGGVTEDDVSFYVRNASASDRTVSPPGKSQLYVLVPVPNRMVGRQDWKTLTPRLREKVLAQMEGRLGLKGLSEHIVAERMITPQQWEEDYNVFVGATFNLAHSLDQMLSLRPHNRLEKVKGVYIVGGGTHPGSGLPTIYESGRISADLLCEDLGVPVKG
ncbi:phytoene desaturase [Candidatus Woesearchaeota archaeon]|nr:phytoene desaturase [Candidatus Woesearchaeota archaeon]